jgi:hypothetical protein
VHNLPAATIAQLKNASQAMLEVVAPLRADIERSMVRCAFSTGIYTRRCHWFPRLLA